MVKQINITKWHFPARCTYGFACKWCTYINSILLNIIHLNSTNPPWKLSKEDYSYSRVRYSANLFCWMYLFICLAPQSLDEQDISRSRLYLQSLLFFTFIHAAPVAQVAGRMCSSAYANTFLVTHMRWRRQQSQTSVSSQSCIGRIHDQDDVIANPHYSKKKNI